MKKCPHCQSDIQGDWEYCPLCRHELIKLEPNGERDPFPKVPLSFNRRKALYLLTSYSVVLVFLFFLLETFQPAEIKRTEYVVLALMSLWLVVLILIRKRRNIAKGIVYLILSFSLLSLYFDYLSGWEGWSLTYAIPLVCSTSLIAMFIAVRVVRLEVEDYVLYLQLAALLGFIPLFFLIFGGISVVWPSWVSVFLSALMLISVFIKHHAAIFSELKKRMDV